MSATVAVRPASLTRGNCLNVLFAMELDFEPRPVVEISIFLFKESREVWAIAITNGEQILQELRPREALDQRAGLRQALDLEQDPRQRRQRLPRSRLGRGESRVSRGTILPSGAPKHGQAGASMRQARPVNPILDTSESTLEGESQNIL